MRDLWALRSHSLTWFSRSINVYDKWLCRGDNSTQLNSDRLDPQSSSSCTASRACLRMLHILRKLPTRESWDSRLESRLRFEFMSCLLLDMWKSNLDWCYDCGDGIAFEIISQKQIAKCRCRQTGRGNWGEEATADRECCKMKSNWSKRKISLRRVSVCTSTECGGSVES